MGALFPRWANAAMPLALGSAVALAALLIVGLIVYVRTPYVTKEFFAVEQPVKFDHRHHTRDDQIACEYCHSGVRTAATAGIPTAELCMGCHSQVWNQSPLLDPVRRAYFTGQPLRWQRVTRLPDFVYFNHSIHLGAGVDCATCHGRVDLMPTVTRARPLTMGWCLSCHREPEKKIRAQRTFLSYPAVATGLGTVPSDLPSGAGRTRLTTCSACHR